jgi:uncharacterized protein YaeQ
MVLSDVDRAVYDTLDLTVARHPSESVSYLVTRVLAYGLNCREGLSFGPGLCVPDEPALRVTDATGRLIGWIDVGLPAPDRLEKASRQADGVRVYVHKSLEPWLSKLRAKKLRGADVIEVFSLDPVFIEAVADTVERKTAWEIVVTEGELFVSCGAASFQTRVVQHPLAT